MKTWFITGASRGFGRLWAEAALQRGDQVAVTARNLASVRELADRYPKAVLPLQLEVTDKTAVDGAVEAAFNRFERLDVVVNNAGYGLFGAIEEVSEQQARDQIETNVFGSLWVAKAAVPRLREQGSGHIIQVSSIGGLASFPNLGLYNASKWAVEGLANALALEVGPLGIHVTIVEPESYSTDWSGASAVHATPMEIYQPARDARKARVKPGSLGDPAATQQAILAVVDADQPPLRIFFGRNMIETARAEYEARLELWERWRAVSEAAHGHPAA